MPCRQYCNHRVYFLSDILVSGCNNRVVYGDGGMNYLNLMLVAIIAIE